LKKNDTIQNTQIITNYYLDLQFQSKYYVDINIYEVYENLNNDAKINYKIRDREDVFKILNNINSEIFLFRIILKEEKIDKKSSLVDSNTQINYCKIFKFK
jgi:hypothetical protein